MKIFRDEPPRGQVSSITWVTTTIKKGEAPQSVVRKIEFSARSNKWEFRRQLNDETWEPIPKKEGGHLLLDAQTGMNTRALTH